MGRKKRRDMLIDRRPSRTRKIIELRPGQTAEIPAPPRRLRRHGREAWDRIWGLGAAWINPQSDLSIVTRLCEYHDERALILKALETMGRVLRGPKGEPYANPLVDQLEWLEKTITKLESLCGLNPSDRTKIGIVELHAASKLEELLMRRQRRYEQSAQEDAELLEETGFDGEWEPA